MCEERKNSVEYLDKSDRQMLGEKKKSTNGMSKKTIPN